MSLSTQIRRVAIKDYKSIAHCDVNLGPLTFLVGPNGSGKSNFLDALGFVADAVRNTLDSAVRRRGGIREILRRSFENPDRFAIRLDVDRQPDNELKLEIDLHFEYFLEVGLREHGGPTVLSEECKWWSQASELATGHFRVQSGQVVDSSFPLPPQASSHQLYLVTASGDRDLAILYRILSLIASYNLTPGSMREPQSEGDGEVLIGDGSNLVASWSKMLRSDPDRAERVMEFFRLVVPAVERIRPVSVGMKETLEFLERVHGGKETREFYASSMSDGTLRALAILVALFQEGYDDRIRALVAIEEPEIALHPGAAEVLLDCLREASLSRQVLVTTHSPDLLDRKDIPIESILAVSADDGETRIAPVDKASRQVIQERLWTAGELMRINQLDPDTTSNPATSELKMRLFP